jgi:hypothetical protein
MSANRDSATADAAYGGLERERRRLRGLLFTAAAIFVGFALVVPWTWTDYGAAMLFMVLAALSLRIGREIERSARSGVARPDLSRQALLLAAGGCVTIGGSLLLGVSEESARLAAILGLALLGLTAFGVARGLSAWGRIEPGLRAAPRHSWGDLLDESSGVLREPNAGEGNDPSTKEGRTAGAVVIRRKAKQRRDRRR